MTWIPSSSSFQMVTRVKITSKNASVFFQPLKIYVTQMSVASTNIKFTCAFVSHFFSYDCAFFSVLYLENWDGQVMKSLDQVLQCYFI